MIGDPIPVRFFLSVFLSLPLRFSLSPYLLIQIEEEEAWRMRMRKEEKMQRVQERKVQNRSLVLSLSPSPFIWFSFSLSLHSILSSLHEENLLEASSYSSSFIFCPQHSPFLLSLFLFPALLDAKPNPRPEEKEL